MPKTSPPAAPRVQPPPPKLTPPSATTYRTQRQEELDVVRARGLAKIFNKHFTTVADRIRQEHEAAELALTEIVKRKAELTENPKEFEGAGGLTLTQLDKLHMELMKRKKDVQRKERDTQELYKRYCSQYEDNEHVARHMKLQKGSDDMSVFRQTDLMISKSTEKGEATQNTDVNRMKHLLEEGQNIADELERIATPDKVWSRVNALNGSNGIMKGVLGEDNNTPDMNLSKKLSFTPDAVAPSTDLGTPAKNMVNTPGAATELSTPMSGDVKATPTTNVARATTTPTLRVTALGMGCDASVMDQSLYMADNNSEVSGLTDIDGATVAEAEWKLTEFLRSETENIKKMFTSEGEEEEAEEYDDIQSYSQSVFTHLGGLTFVSGESDRVGRAAKKAEEMVKQMAEATAWMNDPTLLDSDNDSDSDSYSNSEPEKPRPDWCAFWSSDHNREYYFNKKTNQTCWTKPQGVEIDFTNTKEFTSGDAASVASNATNVSIILQPSAEEKVTVRDYTKSNSTNTVAAGSTSSAAITSTSSGTYDNENSVKVFRPDTTATDNSVNSRGSSTKPSKVLQYRRKRAQQRKKKRIMAAIALTSVAGAIGYMKKDVFFPPAEIKIPLVVEVHVPAEPQQVDRPATTLGSSVDFDLTSAAMKLEEVRKQKVAEQKKLVLEAARKTKIIAERKKEEERKRKGLQRKQEEERKTAEAAALKKQKEEELKMREEERTKEEKRLFATRQKEEAHRSEIEEIKEQELALMELENKEQELALFDKEMHRPWGCNIPLTYLMSRKCWRVASKNPIYDTQSLSQCMME